MSTPATNASEAPSFLAKNHDRAVQVLGLVVFGFLVIFFANNAAETTSHAANIQNVQFKEGRINRTIVPHPSPSNNGGTPVVQPQPQQATTAAPTMATMTTGATTPTTRRSTYLPRGRYSLFSDQNETIARDRDAMIEKWGSWTFQDDDNNKEGRRPSEDFYAAYPHRDVPRAKFPSHAWQLDKDYLAKFLPESIQLVERAQRAIREEYQQEGKDASEMSFTLYRYPDITNVTAKGKDQAGWTTEDSWQALVKRILHAIMTEDTFVFAMGGHSAAAGHGNHFQQSYTLQVQWILEAVFARLGVKHEARNFGNGGLGTIHNGMAAADLYGHDVDMIMWDSGMTEKAGKDIEALHRQAIIGSKFKVPVLWTLAEKQALAYYQQAKVPFGIPGTGSKGLVAASTYKEILGQPYASRYLKCNGEAKSICKKNRYDAVCWIDRPDISPGTNQSKAPGGRAGWHPGNREHQIQGRVLAYTILEALKDALSWWNQTDNYELPDDAWHVTSHYQEILESVKNMNLTKTQCAEFGTKHGMDFICQHPVKSRTEFTPRAFPSHTNIRSLMHPEMKLNLNSANPNMYQPPDVFNPSLHPPEGEIDVLSIVELGVPFESILAPKYGENAYKKSMFSKPPQVTVGKGALLRTASGDDFCDGSVDSWCKRGKSEKCLLRAHNDGRNGILFDGLSGWIVMVIPDLLHGQVAVKMETWHPSGEDWRTSTFVSVNNETESDIERKLYEEVNEATLSRVLKKKPPAFCDNLQFQYAINGQVSSLDAETFKRRKQSMARVVETIVIMDDSEFTGGVETEVEVAIRIIGCGRHNTFVLSHIYWT